MIRLLCRDSLESQTFAIRLLQGEKKMGMGNQPRKKGGTLLLYQGFFKEKVDLKGVCHTQRPDFLHLVILELQTNRENPRIPANQCCWNSCVPNFHVANMIRLTLEIRLMDLGNMEIYFSVRIQSFFLRMYLKETSVMIFGEPFWESGSEVASIAPMLKEINATGSSGRWHNPPWSLGSYDSLWLRDDAAKRPGLVVHHAKTTCRFNDVASSIVVKW